MRELGPYLNGVLRGVCSLSVEGALEETVRRRA